MQELFDHSESQTQQITDKNKEISDKIYDLEKLIKQNANSTKILTVPFTNEAQNKHEV
tara:strand:- start:475 stop:648 length:174 start_codon:yes stop_codon:yes gene_type:complete